MKKGFKKQFRAILNVNGKAQTFAKAADTEADLVIELKKQDVSLSNVIRFEQFTTSTEKRKGRTARKY